MARVGGASDQPGPPGEIPPAFVHVAAPGGFMVRPPGAGPPQLRPGMPPPGNINNGVFSFRKTTLCYISPERDLQMSLAFNVYFLFTWKVLQDIKCYRV